MDIIAYCAYTDDVNATVKNCRNSGPITYKYDTESGCAGGIVGEASNNSRITDCINYGKIVYGSSKKLNSKIKPCMAQIAGLCDNSSVNACSTEGSTNYSNLYKNVPKQAQYCSNGAIGREIKSN